MTATVKNISLYQIETELLQLMELRDEVSGMVIVTEEARAEQREQLDAINGSIAEYVKRELGKVDKVAGFLRECRIRATILAQEELRISRLRKAWEEREAHVKERVAEALAIQVAPDVIADAPQNTVLKRLRGHTNELKLCKSPSSTQVTDETLLPRQYQSITLTMPADVWDIGVSQYLESFVASGVVKMSEPKPMLQSIKEDLKDGPVAGARLIEDSVHIRIV